MSINKARLPIVFLLIAVLFGVLFFSNSKGASESSCAVVDRSSFVVSGANDLRVVSVFCSISDAKGGFVRTKVYRGSHLVQDIETAVASYAYPVTVSAEQDLNKDGIADLAISTGTGYRGSNYNYWVFDKTAAKYTFAGKSARLEFDKNNKNILYAVEDQNNSTVQRHNYVLRFNQLALVSQVSYKIDVNNKAHSGTMYRAECSRMDNGKLQLIRSSLHPISQPYDSLSPEENMCLKNYYDRAFSDKSDRISSDRNHAIHYTRRM